MNGVPRREFPALSMGSSEGLPVRNAPWASLIGEQDRQGCCGSDGKPGKGNKHKVMEIKMKESHLLGEQKALSYV